ncbi:MAG: hypothetical protein QM781_13015 [Chitinophagaceae bacterium]
MKIVLSLTLLLCVIQQANAQFTYKIKADSVKITNDSCTAELILENSTKHINGYLYNRGNGRTEFKSILTKINDSVYTVGGDTLLLLSGSLFNAWRLNGNSGTTPSTHFIGTTDSTRLVFRTNNTERATLLGNGNFLIGSTANANYKLDVNGSIRAVSDIRVNDVLIGKGTGSQPSNTIVGNSSLINNTTGIYNTALGTAALEKNTSGRINTAIGYASLRANTTGENNTAVGANSLYVNTTGSNNVAIGYLSLNSNSSGSNNTTVGYNAMAANTTGYQNTAVGRNAMANNTTAFANTAVGYVAMASNTTGQGNSAVGHESLYYNTTGNSNSALGVQAMQFNTSGVANTSMGVNSLRYNTTGNNNAGFGGNSLNANTTGNYNAALGHSSLTNNTVGEYNTAAGYFALPSNDSGSYNVSVGYRSLRYSKTGSQNIAIGVDAGSGVTSGSSNILIGYNVQAPISNTASNQLNIGNWIYGNGGKIGIGVTSPAAVLQLAAGTATASTAPLKFTSGTHLTTPENGAVEYNGTNYFVTSGSTRYTLAKTLTNTATLNFGSTAAGSSADLTITVTGAADGDAVSLAVPNAAVLSNSSYTAWVSAADTVTVRFNNYSSGSQDPASGTFRVSIMKY